ncbi:hypothetical protein [Celerinatantimonas diazotrophica]|uniref:Lipoprotein n=1 Tax=Celerinatantimonas diazotrophica TaxID=412034 RepID=A0A4R1KAP1_9GAMM|nr:hypothetical protein [Celerinatantimonas diazotrophica]TCK61495.1 hypothetical protein EV690_0494 [Celerinatantimonas diazotrophica]CAG9296958.1 hypothetical protein CEDIAZO_02120 [Celerinatantimonas diazotrophica]
MDKFFSALSVTTFLMLAGCATQTAYQPPKVDNTPVHPTAVIHATSLIQGSILPNFHGTEVAYTRADRRTIDGHSKADSWWGKLLFSNLHTADIFRLDQNKAYKVDFNRRTYWECNVESCPSILNILRAASNQSTDEKTDQYVPSGTETCPLHMIQHRFSVVKTSQEETLSGHQARLYRATWNLVSEDSAHHQNVNKLQIDFWTTSPTGEMKKVWEIHQKLTDTYLKEAHLQDNPLARFLPQDIFRALSAFSGDTDSSKQTWHNDVSRKLATIKGYPLKIDLNWYQKNNACQSNNEQTAATSEASDPSDKLMSMASKLIGNIVKSETKPKGEKPIFHYLYQVHSTKVEPVHDSVFQVPDGFVKKPLPKFGQG